jgi:predicted TIM-barrel fold metal-dependent hydrolase
MQQGTVSREGNGMQRDDMILVSVDDHVIEPADMFERHMPASRRDEAPRIVRIDGVAQWVFQGVDYVGTGLNAVASWPRDEWDNDPLDFSEMRPGCYDHHSRVRDMNADGVLASMCFPTFPGFAGTHLLQAPDKALSTIVVSAYNDWHIDEWCAPYPGRFMPLAILPVWDVDASVAEIRRCAAKGFTAVTFPETPHAVGLPSFYDGHWDPLFAAASDVGIPLCLHIGGALRTIQRPPTAPMASRLLFSPQLSAIAATDLIVSGTFNRFPDLKVAMSEGGIGWIPFLLDRIDLNLWNQSWTGFELDGLTAQELFERNFLACFITDPTALRVRDRIGVTSLAWECDFPHSDTVWPNSASRLWEQLVAAEIPDDEINLITWKNACRFFDFDPFVAVPEAQATVGALQVMAADVDTSETSRAEYRRRYEAAAV